LDKITAIDLLSTVDVALFDPATLSENYWRLRSKGRFSLYFMSFYFALISWADLPI
jgi:hypothetical protein